jgi:hypothetical protein
MAYEQRDNSFSAFKNDRKETDKHCDFTGKGMVNGESMWINIWKKKDKNGNTWLSVSLKPMEGHGQENQTRQPTKNTRPAPNQYQQSNEEDPF